MVAAACALQVRVTQCVFLQSQRDQRWDEGWRVDYSALGLLALVGPRSPDRLRVFC